MANAAQGRTTRQPVPADSLLERPAGVFRFFSADKGPHSPASGHLPPLEFPSSSSSKKGRGAAPSDAARAADSLCAMILNTSAVYDESKRRTSSDLQDNRGQGHNLVTRKQSQSRTRMRRDAPVAKRRSLDSHRKHPQCRTSLDAGSCEASEGSGWGKLRGMHSRFPSNMRRDSSRRSLDSEEAFGGRSPRSGPQRSTSSMSTEGVAVSYGRSDSSRRSLDSAAAPSAHIPQRSGPQRNPSTLLSPDLLISAPVNSSISHGRSLDEASKPTKLARCPSYRNRTATAPRDSVSSQRSGVDLVASKRSSFRLSGSGDVREPHSTNPLHANQANAMTVNLQLACRTSASVSISGDTSDRAVELFGRGSSTTCERENCDTDLDISGLRSSSASAASSLRNSELEDHRQRVSNFEMKVESLFNLSPRDGKDKYQRAVEDMHQKEQEAFKLKAGSKIKSDFEIAMKRNDELRRTKEAESQQQKAAPGSSFARIFKKASQLVSRKPQAKHEHASGSMVATDPRPFFSTSREDALMERRLEAVFVSFALYNKWDGDALVTAQKCHGMSGLRFLSLCRASGLLEMSQLTVGVVKQVFDANFEKADQLCRMPFPNFICALDHLSREACLQPCAVYRAVAALNTENRLYLHV